MLGGCGGNTAQGNLGSGGAVDPELIRVNDTLIINLNGVPAADRETLSLQVMQDGTINMPYMNRIKVTGMTTQGLANYLEREYVSRKIFTTPVVTVRHGGRQVYVYGEVRGPGRANYTPGMTVLNLITANGGFTEYADKRNIIITRDGKQYRFNAIKALENPKMDRPVQPNDHIRVNRTIF